MKNFAAVLAYERSFMTKGGIGALRNCSPGPKMIVRIAAAALVAASLAAAPGIAAHAKAGPHAITARAVMVGGR